MTREEFEALPDITGQCTIKSETRVIDGKTVRVPVFPRTGLLWNEDHEPRHIVTEDGTLWRVGWLQGVQVKYQDETSWWYQA